MSDNIVIRADNLWKRYGLPLPQIYYKGKHWLHTLKNGNNSSFDDGPWALSGVTFEVQRGETLGIIGRNGAGKSTLLKVLAGVSPPTRGRMQVLGRVFSMIELNAGLHPELTGRENVFILGSIMGFSRRQLITKLPAIEEFTELGEWFDRPVRKYSSGMMARLGFSVALNVEADVLLVDEVLSVGDLTFQVKCYDYLENLKKKGASILLVSHSIRQIERICENAILMEQGRILSRGNSKEVVSDYYRMGNEKITERIAKTGYAPVQDSTGEVVVTGIMLVDKTGKEVDQIALSQPVAIRICLDVLKPVTMPIFSVSILTSDMLDVARIRGIFPEAKDAILQTGPTFVECALDKFPLMPGAYTITALVVARDGKYRLAQIERACYFTVLTEHEHYRVAGGLIELEAHWSLGN